MDNFLSPKTYITCQVYAYYHTSNEYALSYSTALHRASLSKVRISMKNNVFCYQFFAYRYLRLYRHERLGAVQRKNSKNPRILWKWVDGSRSHSEFVCGKTSINSSKSVQLFGTVYHMYSVCILLKVVSYYDLSVFSKSVMVSKKNVWMGGGVGGWGELYPSFFWIFGIF